MTEYVVMPGADYQNICNALREKTGGTETIRSGEISSQIAGLSGDQHYDLFWDAYQDNGGNYKDAFSGPSWKDECYNPNKPIVCITSAEHAFSESKITDTKVPIEVHGCSANYMFMSCANLKTVRHIGFFDVTENTTFMAYSYNLENITFDGEIAHSIGFANSSKLTNTSVQSIIDHLADHTGSATCKITWHANVVARMTEEQKATMTAKNWTFVY